MAPIWLIPALTYLCIVQGPCRDHHLMKKPNIMDRIRHRMAKFVKESPCKTPDGKNGECRSISECPSITTIARTASKTHENLTSSICFFDGTNIKVCCPTNTEQPPSLANPCFTPEGNQGRCISVFECEHIAKRLQSPTDEDRAYVRNIRCQIQTRGYKVCCGPPPESLPATSMCVPSAAPLTPECCGVDATGGAYKIMGGTATAIDQYPWLAVIEYKKNDDINLMCGGVLISGRYVLTACHCVKGVVLRAGTPTNVRLGEYDMLNHGRDCVPVAGGDPGDADCTDLPVSIPIERIIPHPDYNSQQTANDIAMLRLSKLAPYTDFIRPICLPTRDVTTNMPSTARLIAAGWGANGTHPSANVKQHVKLPYIAIETCQSAYNVPGRSVTIHTSQICAGGETGKDSCKGDSGGLLMYSADGATFELVGIVNFGSDPCGLENVPGVYAKVYNYIDWIKSNMRP